MVLTVKVKNLITKKKKLFKNEFWQKNNEEESNFGDVSKKTFHTLDDRYIDFILF